MKRSAETGNYAVTRRHALGLLGAGAAYIASGCGGSRKTDSNGTTLGAPVATETTRAGDRLTRYIQGGTDADSLYGIAAFDETRTLTVIRAIDYDRYGFLVGVDRVGPSGKPVGFVPPDSPIPPIAHPFTFTPSGRTALYLTLINNVYKPRIYHLPAGAGMPEIQILDASFDTPPNPYPISRIYAINDRLAACFMRFESEGGANTFRPGDGNTLFFRSGAGQPAIAIVLMTSFDVPVSGDRIGEIIGSYFGSIVLNANGDFTFAAYDQRGNSVLYFVPAGSKAGDKALRIAETTPITANNTSPRDLLVSLNDLGNLVYANLDDGENGVLHFWSRQTGSQRINRDSIPEFAARVLVTSFYLNNRDDLVLTFLQRKRGESESAGFLDIASLVLVPGGSAGRPPRILLQTGDRLFGKYLVIIKGAILNDAGDVGIQYSLTDDAPMLANMGSYILTQSFGVLTPRV